MDLKAVARQTLLVTDQGHYESPSGRRVVIGPAVHAALSGTKTFTPGDFAVSATPSEPPKHRPQIAVTGESTLEAALRLFSDGLSDICVLNFASARNIGGGFLSGAHAQEEELCRASALYRCLESQPGYYRANRAQRSPCYTDHLIYSPRVPFFRGEDLGFLETPVPLSVISSPAPNTGAAQAQGSTRSDAVREAFFRRARQIVRVAASKGHSALVLGAWGCGAFGGDPAVSAKAFAGALTELKSHFRSITFAVLADDRRGRTNLGVFRSQLDELGRFERVS